MTQTRGLAAPMMTTVIDSEAYCAAAARTMRWATALLGADGFAGAQRSVLGLYKAPIGLLAVGDACLAACALRIAQRQFHRDGDFHAHAGNPTPIRLRSYRNAWLAWGAHALGAYDLSVPAFDRLERGLHPQFHGSVDDDEADVASSHYPAGGTAKVANALLAAGRVEAALRAGSFLKALVDEQPAQAKRVLLARDPSGRLIDPDLSGLKDGREYFAFDLRAPGQVCWIFGLILRVFAQLHRVTPAAGWLDSAQRIHGWLMRADTSLYSNVTNGKLAWGAAEMYGATGQAHWLALTRRIGAWVLAEQGADGIWVRRPQYASASNQPMEVSLDTSIERMYYMIDIPRALALSPLVISTGRHIPSSSP